MKLTEECVMQNVVYDGRIIKLYVDDVELPDGVFTKREIVRHPGGASVLFVKNNEVALVRQYRYAYSRELFEIPAGKLEKGENPAVAAARELEEETGYVPKYLKHFLDIYPTPGYTDEIIHIYFTDDGEYKGQNPDEDEFIDCVFKPLEEVVQMIERGEICDSKTVAAIYKYLSQK